MPNKLSNQKSRYLLQHSNNPVNWYPWSKEAFLMAKEENKPVLLSIGYSSCHWCHVMAHESFENKEIASILNKDFISIKLDKEEYPDIDSFYMEYITRNFGSGGWPLNVFINANMAPFHAITYLPKGEFIQTLNSILKLYKSNKKLQEGEINNLFLIKEIDKDAIKKYLLSIPLKKSMFTYGPQFPQAVFLLYQLQKQQNIKEELENLICKGLFDHIEGGWFRYTIDSEWEVPHFEKMLYDQATLLLLCAEAYKRQKDELLKYTIEKTISWLNDHMKLSSNLYGSATDADTSQGEGHYYTIEKTNDEKIIRLFNLKKAGIQDQRYVPQIDFSYYLKEKEENNEIIKRCKEKRKILVTPELDQKSIMSWNCFLNFALLKCAHALDSEEIKAAAIKLFESIEKYHIKEKFYHVIYEKEPLNNQEYLEDYASYLLLLSELVKVKPELNKNIKEVIEKIKKKFIKNNKLTHTAESTFDNFLLWQDSPFPSGGSILLNALINLKSDNLKHFIPLTSGILEFASKSPSFFSFWLYAYGKIKN